MLKGLTGRKFDLTFIQDRDGMPDFMVEPSLKSQQTEGVAPHLLARHEIESYLLEPALFVKASRLAGRKITEAQASDAIRKGAVALKAAARRMSRETAKAVNRHLPQAERFDEAELEVKVDAWFDKLDLKSLATIQIVFPGKETLKEALKVLNGKEARRVTRGNLVASVASETVTEDIRTLLTSLGEEGL